MNPYASGTWIKGALLAAILLLAAAPSARAARENCLKYEPFEVSITGTVYSKIYPGPPDYKSIKDSLYVFKEFFLTPDTLFCMVADSGDELNGDADGVKRVQLELGKMEFDKRPSYMKKFYGKKVRVTGTLYSEFADYARKPVPMMDVTSIVVVKPK